MKRPAVIIVFLLLACWISSCRKKYPRSVEEDGVMYFFRAHIAQQQVNLEAGRRNYYMFSSHGQNSVRTALFEGALRDLDCENCGEAFYLSIQDYGPEGATIINQSLKAGKYEFASDDPLLKLSMIAYVDGNQGLPTFTWNPGTGPQIVDQGIEQFLKAGKLYNYCVSSRESGGCSSTNCFGIKAGANRSYTNIHASRTGARTLSFSLSGQHAAPLKAEWSFGDGKRSSALSPQHTYQFDGSYPVSLRVIDANGDTTWASYNAITQNDASSCAVNYRILSLDEVAETNNAAVALKWRDSAGRVYTTSGLDQYQASYFEIKNVSDAGVNEKGEKIRKLQLSFSCRMTDGINVIDVENAEAIIAVAIP